jgi:hypothetical protein
MAQNNPAYDQWLSGFNQKKQGGVLPAVGYVAQNPQPPKELPPGKSDAEIQLAALEERRKNLRKRGRASTVLTGGAGLTNTAPTASVALLGL